MTVTSNIHVGLTAWASGQSVAVGARRSSNAKAYQATTAGTTGATAPSHATGTVSDGAVSWLWLSSIDYTSYSAWIASIPATLTDAVVGLAWNDGELVQSTDFADVVSISGRTTTSTFSITLKCAPGESFRDHPTAATNPLRYNPAVGVAIRSTTNYSKPFNLSGSYITVDGLQAKGKGTAINMGNSVARNCIFDSQERNGAYGNGCNYINCVFVFNTANNSGSANSAVYHGLGSATYNCTVVRPTDYTAGGAPFTQQYSGIIIRNCVATGFAWTSGAAGSGYSGDHNACESTSYMPGTSNVTVPNSTATFVQPNIAAGLDLRLAAGSGLINVGATDTTNIPAATDIIGTARPQGASWDIGAWEYKSTVTVAFRRPFVQVSA